MEAPSSRHPTDQALSSYSLGKLDDGTAEAVTKHLEACPDCRKRVAEMSADSFLNRVRDAQNPSVRSTPGQARASRTRNYNGSNSPASPSASMLPQGLADHPDYEIKRELGRGGMGVVYLAHNTLMGRDEVLKVMGRQIMERPSVLDRFIREIRAVAKLRHPNIVTAYSAVRFGESIVFAMEYVEGLDLSKLVKAKGPLPIGHACNFVYQAALGLQHAHDEGLVHRDIKPGNLILSRKGEKATVKVLDFGLAKATREEKVDGGLTHEGQALGTPDFIAPEQILDAQSADIRADIYSLGGTLYYLLTGRPPFRANSLYDIYQAHISRDADPLNLVRPEVPAELAALVAKMMAKDPARRFQTPDDVARALTPFFKKGNVAKGPQADVSLDGQMSTSRPASGDVSRQTQPATASGGPAARPEDATEPTVPEDRWQSLIDFRETGGAIEAKPALAPTRRAPWVWPSVAVGVLMFGLFAAWAGGVLKVKTPDGVIVLENVPKDSEILVDGNKATFSWPGAGKPLEIRAVPGQRKVEVKKDGFTTFGEVVTVKTGESEEVTVRLEPLAGADHGSAGWVSLFNGKDLTGWKIPLEHAGGWKVEDGVVIGSGPEVGCLETERGDFKDFHIRLEARFKNGAGGGVLFRIPSAIGSTANGPLQLVGHEVVFSPPAVPRFTGSLNAEKDGEVLHAPSSPLLEDAVNVKDGQWFTLEIVAEGPTVVTVVNGRTVAFYLTTEQLAHAGHIAWLRKDPQSVIEFRKMEIKEPGHQGAKAMRELMRFTGHKNRVWRAAFSVDGRSVLSGGQGHLCTSTRSGGFNRGGDDNTVRLWQVDHEKSLRIWNEHDRMISALAYSPSGRFAASCSGYIADYSQKVVAVYNLETGMLVHRFSRGGPTGRPWYSSLSFSSDDRRLMAACSDGTVQVWDLQSGQEQPKIALQGGPYNESEVLSSTFTPDGRHLVTGRGNGSVQLWEMPTGKAVQSYHGHGKPVFGVSCSSDGTRILSGGRDHTIRLWDVASGRELQILNDPEETFRSIALSPDGRRALSSGLGSSVRLWNLGDGSETCRLEGHVLPVNCVAFSPDGRRAISGSDDQTVRLWQLPEAGSGGPSIKAADTPLSKQ